MINKPYFRVIRPIWTDDYGQDHLADPRYCQEKLSLIHAYHIIQNDFKKIMDYVELHDDNSETFSHRIYELFLRICTEFENNCKGILESNSYVAAGNLNITDYFKINSASKLSEFELTLNVWSPTPKTFKPFDDWNSQNYTPLSWYKSYNEVKHNRSLNFNKASLENLIRAMGGLFVILASQFANQIFSPYQPLIMINNDNGLYATENNLFSLRYPTSWQRTDWYEFDWNALRATNDPYQNYTFV